MTTHNLKGCRCPKGSDIRFCLGESMDKIKKEIKFEELKSMGKDEIYCEWFECPVCKDPSSMIEEDSNYCPNCGVKIIHNMPL